MNLFTPAGRLFHTITVQRLTGKQQTNTGEIVDVWTPSEEVPAEIKPLRGRNVEEAAARTKGRVLSHQITMRYVPDIDTDHCRLVWEGKTFEIFQVVDVLERGIELDILANVSEA